MIISYSEYNQNFSLEIMDKTLSGVATPNFDKYRITVTRLTNIKIHYIQLYNEE
jgi:hypothetical protein